jgi:hypothetical protein
VNVSETVASSIPTIRKFNYTEASVFGILKKTRYAPEACALLPQVANTTGSGASRTADAIAMQLWPSRGMTIEGIEIKVDRRDWLRELEQPEKADVIYKYCDKWYVCAPAGIVDLKKDNFPKTWGLLEISQTKDWLIEPDGVDEHGRPQFKTAQEPEFRVTEKVKAPENADAQPPSRGFVASLLRNMQRHSGHEEETQRLVKAAEAKGFKSAETMYEARMKREKKTDMDLRANVRTLEVALGFDIQNLFSWRSEEKLKELRRKLDLITQMEEDTKYMEQWLSTVQQKSRAVAEAVEQLRLLSK